MQKKIASFLFSTRLTGFLFIVFAIAMGIGTFLDAHKQLLQRHIQGRWSTMPGGLKP